MSIRLLISAILTTLAAAQNPAGDQPTAPRLIQMAKSNAAGLRDAITTAIPDRELKAGTGFLGLGPDFFFALETPSQPSLFIDDAAGPSMSQIAGTGIWWASAAITQVGKLHSFYYMVHNQKFGGRLDLPAYEPLWYAQPGVPAGKLSDPVVHVSKLYDGMKSEYRIYVPAQYSSSVPAALMVFQDGSGYSNRATGDHGVLNAIDNLIAQKRIPVVICVFINPGKIGDSPGTPTYNFVKGYSEKWKRTLDDSMRSTLYDTVSDKYPRFLRDEVLADVQAKYNIRRDAYSRAITGLSSGGICAFNAAWQMPEQFSRVITWIGSFTSIQWKEDAANPDGGQDFPEKVLREPARNIRVWLADGTNDQENPNYGSWPLANVRLANALKTKNYDFRFSLSKGTHNPGHGAAEFPDEMIWLWRDYDPTKTSETYRQEPGETGQPLFRVGSLNRAAP